MSNDERPKLVEKKTAVNLARPIFRGFDEFEASIGVEPGFFQRLQSEDDWSFVIKLHAVFEALATHLLSYYFQEEALHELLARLELSNKTTGKVAFLKALGLLGKEHRRYISSLSELRNNLVHDIRNCPFDLKEIVSKYSENELRTFALDYSPLETQLRLTDEKPPRLKKKLEPEEVRELMVRAKENPKTHIWIGGHNVIVSLLDKYGYTDFRHWEKANDVFCLEEETDDSEGE